MEYTHPPRPDEDNRCDAITDLIRSVSEQQEALARILDAEHEKVEKAAELCGSDVDDLVEIDKSVERVLVEDLAGLCAL